MSLLTASAALGLWMVDRSEKSSLTTGSPARDGLRVFFKQFLRADVWLAGLLLGLAISLVLVHVVNPQSFHWTMELLLPWGRLALLCAAMAAAGTLTAWWAGRAAGSRQAALAVKEDW